MSNPEFEKFNSEELIDELRERRDLPKNDLSDFSSDDLIEELDSRYDLPITDLSEFDEDDLKDELFSRGYVVGQEIDQKSFFEKIYQKIINNEEYEGELHFYLKEYLGKAI